MNKKKKNNEILEPPHAYLIRIANREDRIKAQVAFLHVHQPRCRFRDNQYLVTKGHIMALKEAGIPFEDITDKT